MNKKEIAYIVNILLPGTGFYLYSKRVVGIVYLVLYVFLISIFFPDNGLALRIIVIVISLFHLHSVISESTYSFANILNTLNIEDPSIVKLIEENLEKDNIDLDKMTINLTYLSAGNFRPKWILPREEGAAETEDESLKLTEVYVNRNSKNIACNISLRGFDYYFPSFIQKSKADYFWYFAAYPDVFTYFHHLPDVLSDLWKNNPQEYMNAFDKTSEQENKKLDKFLGYYEENPFDKTITNSEYFGYYYLLRMKDYYKIILNKKLELDKSK